MWIVGGSKYLFSFSPTLRFKDLKQLCYVESYLLEPLTTQVTPFCQKKNSPQAGIRSPVLTNTLKSVPQFVRSFSQVLNKQNVKCNWVLFDSIRFCIIVCTFNLCPEQKRTTIIMKCSSVARTKELIFLNSKTNGIN